MSSNTDANYAGGFLPLVIDHCRRRNRKLKLVDSTGAQLTGGATLTRALVLRRLLNRHYLAPDEQTVGILMPPTVAGAVVNLALALDRRVSVNLNFMLSPQALQDCLVQAGIRHVITSRKVLDRLKLEIDAELIILEDFAQLATKQDKAIAAFHGMAMPQGNLVKHLGLDQIQADDLLTILFTSGSTGEPKGVMLSHRNIGSNCVSIAEGISIREGDVLIGVLPFFHAFGLTATLWMPLVADAAAAYHTSPLEPDAIGQLTREQRGTILLSTPTFLRLYTARCKPEDLATLDMVVTGAEHLPPDTADRFERKFGTRPFEGYGVTETAPAISINVPSRRAGHRAGLLLKDGTVGKPLPDVSVRVVDRLTGDTLGPNQEGLLHASGPNVMVGYLDRPDLTAQVLQNGWYNTGDVAKLDEEGFITITGRESQFSKIGGEMVPHLLIEETIASILGDTGNDEVHATVTAIPDDRKGERLVVIHSALPLTPDQISGNLRERGLPPLYIPSPDSFVEVEAMPVLPTGKVDLREIREIAQQAFDDTGKRRS